MKNLNDDSFNKFIIIPMKIGQNQIQQNFAQAFRFDYVKIKLHVKINWFYLLYDITEITIWEFFLSYYESFEFKDSKDPFPQKSMTVSQ